MTKYVCVAIHSTCQCKYWNRTDGWNDVVKYLNDKGYIVKHISKESGVYMGNYPPEGSEDCTGLSIDDTISLLKDCEFFMGVSSGLAWLAWGVGVPVIMVSGFTAPWFEPSQGVERVFNPDVCNSCFNDPTLAFDRGDWMWCPRGKNFECSKEITSGMVIERINKITNDVE